jgi:hypothetical protein
VDASLLFHAEIDAAGSARRPKRDPRDERVLDDQARSSIINLIDDVAWGEVQAAMSTLDEALRRGLEATEHAFDQWENEAGEMGYNDEFSLEPADIDALSDEWRLAYVARQLRSIALTFGTVTEFADGPLGAPDDRCRSAPGAILRHINAIVKQALTRRGEGR